MNADTQSDFTPFFVPGMPRSGTTFLFHAFRNHPGICLPNRKEVDYFNSHWEEGESWFRQLYQHRQQGQLCGDISPSYFLTDDFWLRVPESYPDSKVIVGVRDPVDYAVSFYRQRQTFDYDLPPFREFLECYRADFGGNTIQVGFSDDQVWNMIEKMREAFGERLLLFDFCEVQRNPVALLRVLESFLSIEHHLEEGKVALEPVNASGRKNRKWLTYLLSRPLVVSTAEKVLPRPVLQKAHSLFYRLTSGKAKADFDSALSPEDLEYARGLMADQSEKVCSLFAEGSFVLGTGRVYEENNALATS